LPKIPENLRNDQEPALKPYRSHGVQLTAAGTQATGTCPFCGREGKFSAQIDSGLFRCLVCNASGNPLGFLRLLWERSDAVTNGQGKELADDRGYLDHAVLTQWGVCKSIIDGTWLIPGYSVEDGKPRLDQLYRRTRMLKTKDGRATWVNVLLPTSGIWPEGRVHALHMPSLHFDPAKGRVDVFEGPWDAMAYWEVASQCKRCDDGTLEFTGNIAASLVGDSNVIAVPGAGTWRPEWTELCRGKVVTFHYDNDHPKEHPEGSGVFTAAGRDGVKRCCGLVAKAAREVHWLQWGGGGFDASLPSGFDVRDWLVKGTVEGRS
jgi:hypothetical protein